METDRLIQLHSRESYESGNEIIFSVFRFIPSPSLGVLTSNQARRKHLVEWPAFAMKEPGECVGAGFE
jgi:hypothetical protein